MFNNEPNLNASFLSLDNVLLTPHIGSATLETRIAMTNLAIDNLEAFFKQAGFGIAAINGNVPLSVVYEEFLRLYNHSYV